MALSSTPSTETSQHELAVEDVDQSSCVLVGHAANDAEALLLDRCRQLPHAETGGVLSLKVFVDDGDRKGLKKIHATTP